MTRYLLGDVTEEEQLRLEQQFFTDDESYQQLLALEDELKYEYAQGGLTPQQRKTFEKRFLVTPQDRQKVEVAAAVLSKSYEVAKARKRSAFKEKLTAFFTFRSPAMQFACGAAALLLLLLFQTVRLQTRTGELEAARKQTEAQTEAQRQQQEQLRQELAKEQTRRTELEKQLGNHQTPPTSFLSFVLVPGLVRDADGPKRLVVPPDANEAHFQFEVKSKAAYKNYRAELQTVEGDQIFGQNISRPELIVPARFLRAGDYMVMLKGANPQGEMETLGEYYFVVVRR